MRYVVTSGKSVEQATADLEAAVKQHGFGVLHAYDLKQTLASKGVELPHECRISVCEDGGQTRIGMVRPTALLASLSELPGLREVAEEVEQATIRMIEDAR